MKEYKDECFINCGIRNSEFIICDCSGCESDDTDTQLYSVTGIKDVSLICSDCFHEFIEALICNEVSDDMLADVLSEHVAEIVQWCEDGGIIEKIEKGGGI